MAHWAQSPIDRSQVTLFSPTLDDSIRADHPVRLVDEVLRALDFAPWESMYIRVVGQPPIHPRVLAACILYGLSLGIRSSRKLQDAACNRLDFIWLLEGHAPDHSTICKFRTQFGREIKSLFRQVARVAMEMGLIALNQVTLDGTDLKASNSRYATGRKASLQEKLDALDRQMEQMLQEAGAQDRAEDQLLGADASPAKLPPKLRDLRRRQDRLRQAMANLKSLEADRKARSDTRSRAPAIPLTDPQSRVIQCKQGGYAPGYTGVLAVDSQGGIIVDVQVVDGNDERSTVLPTVTHIQESLGAKPVQLAADCGFNTGMNLAGLERMGVEPLMPARQTITDNPAPRPDPSQPVAEADRPRLPIRPQNKVLDKAAFVYDAGRDRYFCPMGQVLSRERNKHYTRSAGKGIYRRYRCAACAGCPLATQCLPRGATQRTVSRDEYEDLRQTMGSRLASEQGKAQYKRRSWVAETPFAVLKAVMNFRQFLLRGLDKARTELRWAATAYNIVKLTRRWRPAPSAP